MPKLFQINSFCNTGSTGRIAENLGLTVMAEGWESWIAYGRTMNPSQSHIYRIGDECDVRWHGVETRLFDRQGLASKDATRRLVSKIKDVQPDIIHLHNLHGYYLNYPILFRFLKEYDRPIVWTLHDCWSFTGHCPYFEYEQCFRWREQCHDCPNKKRYPASLYFDRSQRNYRDKKMYFTSLDNVMLVPVSNWLVDYVRESFLGKYPLRMIHNGIDTDVFRPKGMKVNVSGKYNLHGRFLIIGVAGVWEERKGLMDFFKLRQTLSEEYDILIIGLSKQQIAELPRGIIGVERTESVNDLAEIYSAANVLFNPTMEDTLPTVNLESQSCGTPVVCYETGGCPETINNFSTGYVITQHDLDRACLYIKEICRQGKDYYRYTCREYILEYFQNINKYQEYMSLYESLLDSH